MQHQIVITTVGTSMFTNFMKEKPGEIDKAWKQIKDKSYSKEDWDSLWEDYLEPIKLSIEDWGQFSCAELKTLQIINEKYSDVSTFLVTTDTLSGYLAGQILETLLPQKNITVHQNKKIEDFDVLSKDKFKIRRGFDNYIKFLIQTYAESYNISGGYKAIIPITTLIASLKKIPIFYNFEESEMLIEVPPFPFEWHIERFEKFETFFDLLQKEGPLSVESAEVTALQHELKLPEEQRLLQTLTVVEDELVSESEIGKIYREAYLENKTVELVSSPIHPNEKTINLAEHHSKNLLSQFWDKIKKSPYVESCVCSIEYQPRVTKLIHKLYDSGEIDIVLHRTLKKYSSDAGYAMKIKTTGRNIKETQKIADLLSQEYDI